MSERVRGTEQTYADHRPLLGSGDSNWARVVHQSVEDGIGERGIAGDHAPMLNGNWRGTGGQTAKFSRVGMLPQTIRAWLRSALAKRLFLARIG